MITVIQIERKINGIWTAELNFYYKQIELPGNNPMRRNAQCVEVIEPQIAQIKYGLKILVNN